MTKNQKRITSTLSLIILALTIGYAIMIDDTRITKQQKERMLDIYESDSGKD